jgi:hypothetical protein
MNRENSNSSDYEKDIGAASDKQICSQNYFLPKPESFPIEVLPDIYGNIVKQAASAFAVPLEVPACALLSLSGACIGLTRGLTIKRGYNEYANLYLAIVANSGIGKSPCTKAIFNPIFRVEKKWYDEFQAAQQKYKQEIYARKHFKKKDKLSPPPSAPIWKQIFVDDATVESLTDALDGNPRGILWYRDELAGLILELDKYTGKDGGTKTRLMTAHDSGVWKTNRVNSKRVNYIQKACLSIFGTIQPGILPKIFSNLDAATGFLPRFLFVRVTLENPPVWSDESFGNKCKAQLDSLVDRLLSMDFLPSGEPQLITVQPEAKSLYKDWYNRQVCEPWVDFDAQAFEALSAKLRAQCLRFCLILHCLHSIEGGQSELEPISADTMGKAIRLADWFKVHQRQVWQIIGKAGQVTDASPLEKRVAAAIVALEDEIQNGTIPTGRITEKINEGASKQFQVSTRSVGRVCGEWGLGHKKTSSLRLIVITQENMQKLKSITKNATNATNATNDKISDSCRDGIKNFNATNATAKGGISGIKETNAMDVKPHQLTFDDISGISGVSSEKNVPLRTSTRPDEVEI